MNNVTVEVLPLVQIQHINNLKSGIEPYEVHNESVQGTFILNYFNLHDK